MFQFPTFALPGLLNSAGSDWELPQPSFLIRKSPDRRLFASFPEHIAGYHVLHRLSMPRHPPYTLSSLTTFIDHRHNGRVMTGAMARKLHHTINNGSIAKKVLDDIHPTEKLEHWRGDHAFAGVDIAEDCRIATNSDAYASSRVALNKPFV